MTITIHGELYGMARSGVLLRYQLTYGELKEDKGIILKALLTAFGQVHVPWSLVQLFVENRIFDGEGRGEPACVCPDFRCLLLRHAFTPVWR